ncbi:AraC family transcriptional regulator [Companilactobacillus sp. HBUAS56275]|uniref:AraC family transcriptional regulator n=1 Tax=Candidatus Companilactobacillus pullicola TaxID=2838523 RepID=A0A9D2CMG3_9LACO|nr:AraC family transcriptional regulator [Candidatus Companilactobacillus pullicola]
MHGNQLNFFEFNKVQFEVNFDFCGQAMGDGATNKFTIKNNYVLHYILSGHGDFQIKGHTYHLSKNDCFIIPRGIPVSYFSDKNDPWEYIWIGLSGTQVDDYLRRSTLMDNYTLTLKKNSKFIDQFLHLSVLSHNSDLFPNDLLMLAETYKLLYLLISEYPKQNNRISTKNQIFKQACQFIESNYDTDISINQLAENLDINRTYLHRIFKETIDKSPQNFILELRMKKSRLLLLNSNYGIAEISYSVGYKDPFNFSKAFHKFYGMSPSAFRHDKSIILKKKIESDDFQ